MAAGLLCKTLKSLDTTCGQKKCLKWCATCYLHERAIVIDPVQAYEARNELTGKRSQREGRRTMTGKKKQVKPAAKKDPKKTLKGAKKLGETKLMIVY